MKVHLLNCATIRPYVPPLQVATCCLLIESDSGLTLVDTGLGTQDHLEPGKVLRAIKRLSQSFGTLEETAAKQLVGLGYSAADVQQIVMTHLHVDHAGGLPDFPAATVHVYGIELRGAQNPSGLKRLFYRSSHWAHGPKWAIHADEEKTDWFSFEALPVVEDAEVKLLLVPLPGHTRGHCGVAVGDGERWVLHCGDAVALDALRSRPGRLTARLLGPNHRRLYQLARRQPNVQVLPAHVWADKLPTLRIAN